MQSQQTMRLLPIVVTTKTLESFLELHSQINLSTTTEILEIQRTLWRDTLVYSLITVNNFCVLNEKLWKELKRQTLKGEGFFLTL